eukprot:TRINITY_DN5706_c0_g1_i1.p1 TRINITY_DN5706_c0_g1~~TRINITY_DN5706_c0_g1_i1.p1  ORF type:complete len:156 (+),score=36.05 TRINITY_DN5706_c0_g1_i1:130-597(+)
MTLTTIALDSEFGYVILAAAGIAFQIILMGFAAGGLRRKPKFKAVEYPDNGSGIFAHKLPVEDWKEFNNYQRVHYNYLEGIASILTFLLLSGVFYPRYAAINGAIYIVGRQLYAFGYWSKGPKGRMIGALLLDLALVALFGSTIRAGLALSGLYP